MKTTTTSPRNIARIAALPIAALDAVGLAFGAAGVANAGTLPTTGPTIAMTINNDTDNTMYLEGSSNPYGHWIAGPRDVLAPHSSEIVTAYNNDRNGIGVDVTYKLPGDAHAVFSANDYVGNVSTDGTRVDGYFAHLYNLNSNIDTGSPNMNVSYDLYMNNPLMK